MLNQVIMHGRLTKDPELRYTSNQTPVASFSIAVDQDTKDRTADFFDCVAWKGTGEFISKYFGKGSQIVISGRLSNRAWEDKNGNKRISTEIVVHTADFCDKKPSVQNAEPEFVEMADVDGELPF